MSGLFTISTQYDDKAKSENRLTQVFAAAFNNSIIVRRIFLNQIGVICSPCDCFIETQIQMAESTRPDMVLYLNKKRTKFIVIESKTDLKTVKSEQLKGHESFAKKYFGSVKIFVLISLHGVKVKRNWKTVLWSDLANKLASVKSSKTVDYFVCQNLVEFFKEYGYMVPTVISVSSFENVSKFIYALRSSKPHTRLDYLDELKSLTDFISKCMEQIVASSDMNIDKKCISQRLSNWYLTENPKVRGVTFGAKQPLSNTRNGVTHVGLMLQEDQPGNGKFMLTFNAWIDDYFTTLACWRISDNKFQLQKKDTQFRDVGKMLTLDFVVKIACEVWKKCHALSQQNLGFGSDSDG